MTDITTELETAVAALLTGLPATIITNSYQVSDPTYPALTVEAMEISDYWETKYLIKSAVVKVHCITYTLDDKTGAVLSDLAGRVRAILQSVTLTLADHTVHSAFYVQDYRDEPGDLRRHTFELQVYFS